MALADIVNKYNKSGIYQITQDELFAIVMSDSTTDYVSVMSMGKIINGDQLQESNTKDAMTQKCLS